MKSSELRQERAALIANARKLFNKAKEENREPNSEETENFNKLMVEAEAKRKAAEWAEQGEQLDSAEAELRSVSQRKSSPIINPSQRGDYTEADRKAAFRAWALAGSEADINPDVIVRAAQSGVNVRKAAWDMRALSKATDAAGNYTVPTGFAAEMDKALKWYAPIRQYVRVIPTADGKDWEYPQVTDVDNAGAVVSENGAPGTSTDPTFGQVVFKSQRVSSGIVKVATQLLQDNAVDLEAELAGLLAERVGRKETTDYTTGAGGGSAPTGIVTCASAAVNLASGNALTWQKLKSLEHAVDVAYRSAAFGFGYMMHDSTFAAVELISDDAQRPLFVQSLTEPSQYRLFGAPVHINNSFAEYIGNAGDDKPLILAGPFKKFVIRDVVTSWDLVRFNELYQGNGQVGFQFSRRGWSELIGPAGCIKSLNSYNS